MSATGSATVAKHSVETPVTPVQHKQAAPAPSNYKGFVAGVFSGIAKLSGEL